MTTQEDIDNALYLLKRKASEYAGELTATVKLQDYGPIKERWRMRFSELLLDEPVRERSFCFERDTPASPWRYVRDEK